MDLLGGDTNKCAADGRGTCRGDRVNSSASECSNDLRVDQAARWHTSRMNEFLEGNRELWDEWTGIHESSEFYDLRGVP